MIKLSQLYISRVRRSHEQYYYIVVKVCRLWLWWIYWHTLSNWQVFDSELQSHQPSKSQSTEIITRDTTAVAMREMESWVRHTYWVVGSEIASDKSSHSSSGSLMASSYKLKLLSVCTMLRYYTRSYIQLSLLTKGAVLKSNHFWACASLQVTKR